MPATPRQAANPRQATEADLPAISGVITAAYARYLSRMDRPPAPVLTDYRAAIAAGQVWVLGEPMVGVIVLIDQLGEYSVPGKTIGHGSRTGTITLTSPAPKTSVQDSAIQQLLQQEIAAKNLPAPGPNSLYFFFLPPGVKVVQGGSASCTDFCGYHDSTSGNIFYAVMPYPGCSGCTGGLTVADALTSTSSHELCEAITDPVPGQGWYDDNNGEIGDICAWKTRVLGGYTIQLEWSNNAGACV